MNPAIKRHARTAATALGILFLAAWGLAYVGLGYLLNDKRDLT